jgi:hypothetical protein
MATVHLMGLGPSWSLAPQCGPGVKVWGMNNVLNWRPVDYVFEVHDWYQKMNRVRQGDFHQRAVRTAIRTGTPYIVRERYPFFPGLKQVVYPWEAIFEEFQSDFLGCSMDCMMAMAIYCGYTDIQLYGIGINRASHYDFQIPSMNYWLGVCHGRGINIHLNQHGGFRHTDLLRTVDGKVYGCQKPQRKWPTLDPSLPECACVKRHDAHHCFDFK